MKKILSILLVFIFTLVLVSCGQQYFVVFDSDGAGFVAHQELKKNEYVIKPADPSKDGYVFKFWQDKETDEEFDFENTKVKKDYELLAIYSEDESFTVTFDFDYDNKVEEVLVLNNALIKDIPTSNRFDYNIVHWTLDGEEFNFKRTKVTKDITLKAVWVAKDEMQILKDLDYTNLIETILNLDLEFNIPKIDIVNDNDEVLFSIENIKVNALAKADLRDSNYLVSFETEIYVEKIGVEEISIKELSLVQKMFIKDNNVYSSFQGTFIDPFGEERNVSELVSLLRKGTNFASNIDFEIPSELIDVIDVMGPLLTNYKEYQKDALDSSITNEVNMLVNDLGFMIEMFLTEELLSELPLKFTNNNNNVDITLDGNVDNVMIEELVVSLIRDNNKFDKLVGTMDLKVDIPFDVFSLSFDVLGSLSLTTNNEDFEITEDLSEYELVDELRITSVTNNRFYEVTLDTDGGNDIDGIKVLHGQTLESLNIVPEKPGYRFSHWLIDNEEFDLSEKIFSPVTLIAVWVIEDNEVLDILTHTNYEGLLNETLEFNLSVTIPSIEVEEEGQPGLKVNDIVIDVDFKSNFITYEESVFSLDVNISTGEIQSNIFGSYSPILYEVILNQRFYLLESNIYIEFEGAYRDASNTYKPLTEFIGFFEMLIIPNLPIEIQDIISENYDLVEDYKEVLENVFTEEIYEGVKISISVLPEFIKLLITREAIDESILDLLVTNSSDINITIGNSEDFMIQIIKSLIEEFEINFITEDYNFKELNLKLYLNESFDNIKIDFSLKVTENDIVLPDDLDEYTVVTETRFDKLIISIERNNYKQELIDFIESLDEEIYNLFEDLIEEILNKAFEDLKEATNNLEFELIVEKAISDILALIK